MSCLKLYKIRRTEGISWCQDYEMVVIAEDELYAERRARLSSDDFRRAKNLDIEEINMDEERYVLISNTGA